MNILLKCIRALSRWAWKKEIETINSYAHLAELSAEPGKLKLRLEQKPEIAQYVAASFAQLVKDSPNYTELKFATVDEHVGTIYVLVRKDTGKTPHELRREAEAQLAKLRVAGGAMRDVLEKKVHGCSEISHWDSLVK